MAIRRAPAAAAAKPVGGTVNFGDDSFYLGGLGLPEGDYAMTFHTQMFQPTKQNGQPVGTAFLAVMATAYPLGGGEPSEHPLGCGRKAHLSFVPSEDGKGFDAVPGGTGIGMSEMANWGIFRKSLRDTGLPEGILSNDITVLDGIHVHTQNIPEPEERKGFGNTQTGEAALEGQPEQARNRTCMIVTEIKPDGRPWEGTGGLPQVGGAPAKPIGKTNGRGGQATAAPVRRAVAVAAAPPVEEQGEEVSEEDLRNAALNGLGAHLEKTPARTTKLALRTGTFAAVSKVQGEDVANAVLETYFVSDAALGTILSELGYQVSGQNVTPLPQ